MNTEFAPLALCVTSGEMNVVWCDDAYVSLLEMPRNALISSNVIEYTHPQHRSVNLDLLDSLRSGGSPFTITKRYQRRDGSSVWVRNHVSALIDPVGGPRVLASVQRLAVLGQEDASLLDRAERALRRRRARLLHLQRGRLPEGAVDILLDLFVHRLRNKPVSVSSACLAARVPETTALRHVDRLTRDKLIARRKDSADGRRWLLELTSEGVELVDNYLRFHEG